MPVLAELAGIPHVLIPPGFVEVESVDIREIENTAVGDDSIKMIALYVSRVIRLIPRHDRRADETREIIYSRLAHIELHIKKFLDLAVALIYSVVKRITGLGLNINLGIHIPDPSCVENSEFIAAAVKFREIILGLFGRLPGGRIGALFFGCLRPARRR